VREEKLKNKVLLFDPIAGESLKFNIFSKSMLPEDRNDLRAYVANVANIIFAGQSTQNNSNSTDGYFEGAAKSAFTFFAQWLIYKNEYTSIPHIRSKLLEGQDTSQTIENMIEDNSTPEEIKEDGRGVLLAANSENQWAGVIGQLNEALGLFADTRIKNVTNSTCDFTGHTLRQEKTTVYLKVRDQDKKRLRPLLSLMLDSVSTQLVSKMPEAGDNNITFVLDEFVRLGKMDFISELPSISRGYKLNFIFVAQDYEQISNTYGQGYISIFETNCAYKIVFRQNNFSTAERISKLIGNKTTSKKSTSKNKSQKTEIKISFQGNSGKSESASSEGIALVTPQDILSLKSDHCLIIVQGHASKPILANNPMWFNEKKFKDLINN
jgi:type IV secretion system protein VirD4